MVQNHTWTKFADISQTHQQTYLLQNDLARAENTPIPQHHYVDKPFKCLNTSQEKCYKQTIGYQTIKQRVTDSGSSTSVN